MSAPHQPSNVYDVYSLNLGHQIEVGFDQGSYYLKLTQTDLTRRKDLGSMIPVAQADLILLCKDVKETLDVNDGYYRIIIHPNGIYVLEGESETAHIWGGRTLFNFAIRELFKQLDLLDLLSG